eukprot:TRINITY_DN21673_c0_g1_i1.p1 TRINITY_DN21673_c0_g1~~TRINITY_DN21673_c0_g1_i1.p1  ORF type:complete len:187 (-),score=54.61 TRINITY_DN21673_c0_g1_i1:210-698(-)
MARAARLSGSDPGEDTEEFLELQEKLKHPEKMTRFERAKYSVQQLVEKVGFSESWHAQVFPTSVCLAGITCGHFLIPFWTFFGATLIGKAIIKMHIQKILFIFASTSSCLRPASPSWSRSLSWDPSWRLLSGTFWPSRRRGCTAEPLTKEDQYWAQYLKSLC